MLAFLSPKAIIPSMDERGLYKTKWWDERLITSPDMATFRFVRQWVEAHARAWHRCGLDHREDVQGNAVALPYPYTSGTIEYFQQVNGGDDWRAFQRLRRLADVKGIPYPLMASAAVAVVMGTDCCRLDVRTTNPTMIRMAIMDEVRNRLAVLSIPLAEDPYFSAAEYRGTELQDAYLDWLVERVKERWRDKAAEKLMYLSCRGKIHAKYFFSLHKKQIKVK